MLLQGIRVLDFTSVISGPVNHVPTAGEARSTRV